MVRFDFMVMSGLVIVTPPTDPTVVDSNPVAPNGFFPISTYLPNKNKFLIKS